MCKYHAVFSLLPVLLLCACSLQTASQSAKIEYVGSSSSAASSASPGSVKSGSGPASQISPRSGRSPGGAGDSGKSPGTQQSGGSSAVSRASQPGSSAPAGETAPTLDAAIAEANAAMKKALQLPPVIFRFSDIFRQGTSERSTGGDVECDGKVFTESFTVQDSGKSFDCEQYGDGSRVYLDTLSAHQSVTASAYESFGSYVCLVLPALSRSGVTAYTGTRMGTADCLQFTCSDTADYAGVLPYLTFASGARVDPAQSAVTRVALTLTVSGGVLTAAAQQFEISSPLGAASFSTSKTFTVPAGGTKISVPDYVTQYIHLHGQTSGG
ncbi:MAG: hypothetical protein P4M02_10365 [Clostridia bacterium]|nr:hypothetical protein [Clostridia bacterium]